MTPSEDRRAIEALEASILHWRRILIGVDSIAGGECPLCQVYGQNAHCDTCPICKKTKQAVCYGTPYPKLNSHITHIRHLGLSGRIDPTCPTCIELTYKMLDFLQDLLIQYLQDKPVGLDEPDASSEKAPVHEIRVEVRQDHYGIIDLSWWGDPTDAPSILQHLRDRDLITGVFWEDDEGLQITSVIDKATDKTLYE